MKKAANWFNASMKKKIETHLPEGIGLSKLKPNPLGSSHTNYD